MTLHSLNPLLKVIEKIAPGAPPKPNWEWHEETSRWRNPENWEEIHGGSQGTRGIFGVGTACSI